MKRLFCKNVLGGLALLVMGTFVTVPTVMATDVAGVNISGFVDASFSKPDNSNSTFSLDQVEIDIKKKLSDKLSIRADINYLPKAAVGFDDLIEQGYVTVKLDRIGTGVDLTIGKFNAPIGFELLDPVDMYQFSHSLVFDNGLPTNLTGVMGAYTVNEMFDIAAYVVNGWDKNTDTNQNKTIGGRLGVNPVPGVNVGFSVISGIESTTTTNNRTVFDIDATITMIDHLTVGLEYNSGTENKASVVNTGTDADWTAFLLMGHYEIDDTYGVTLRYDTFNDKDGFRLGNSLDETQRAFTLAGTMALDEGAGLIAEWRRLDSDQNVFNGTDTTDTFAVELTYSF